MQKNFPKFDKKIQEQINNTNLKQQKTRPGTIMGYDKLTNTAIVVLDEQYSSGIGNVIKNVQCPMIRGIQVVSPTIGTRCLVGFRDNNEALPYIINYYNDTSSNLNYYHNDKVRTGIPRFMIH